MQPPDDEERRWARAVQLYYDGAHTAEVCRRFGINRRTLATWCDRIDFRVTWVDPLRRPPVPSPAPDHAPERVRAARGG